MAEAIDWDDTSAATVSGQPVAADEAWHVAVAQDDVKVVSLEQLDDMFRLSLVDSETKVWQPGMSEWVPLGVIAGLDEKPAPPQRTYPKPPSPRSAPPPPRRASVAPLASVPSVPPASFYAEPLRPVTYAAPLAPIPSMAPIASVRPLVVSHNPYAVPQSGGSFGRFIVGLALVAGVSVSLYRNDVLRNAAHSLHQDGLYAKLEQKLGGPSFGTLSALEQNASSEAAATLTLPSMTSSNTMPTGADAALATAVPAPTPNPADTNRAASGSQPPVVSLESLGTEKAGAASAKPDAKASVAVAAAPIAKPASEARASSFASAPAVKSAPVAKAPPTPPEPKAKAAPAEKPAPAPVASKPESEMTPRERLNAEIARAMQTSPASAKKSKPASTGLKGSGEYDPLNPKL
ncbi:MAG TPA: DUF4339 domain-containing protein [Polyangiaceae bacterium]|nr:DUF4339 domain-containing protein [Polyangiaceae bacterium]